MSSPNPLSRGKTFVLACSFLVIAAATTSVLQLHQIYRASQMTAAISDRWLPSVSKSAELGSSIMSFRKAQFEYLVASNEGDRGKFERLIEEENQNLFIHKKFIEPLLESNEEKILYDAFSKNLDEYVGLNAKFVDAVKAGNRDPAETLLFQDSSGIYQKMIDGIKKLNAVAYGEGIAMASSVSEAHRVSLGYTCALLVLCGLLGGLLFYGNQRLQGATATARATGVLSIAKKSNELSEDSKDSGKKAA